MGEGFEGHVYSDPGSGGCERMLRGRQVGAQRKIGLLNIR